LFNQLRIVFPSTWGSLPSLLSETLTKDFEEGMGQIFNSDFSIQIAALMRNMAEYFCQFQISSFSENLYSCLLDTLKPSLDKIVFSSLNYDLLLEYTATSKEIVTNYFLDRQDSKEIIFWKLHGSCNFLPANIQLDSDILFQSNIIWDTTLRGVDPRDAFAFCRSQTGLYPAMCIYMKSKPTQIGYTQIKSIQNKWREAILHAEKVLIIGVKPYLANTHIWEPLTQTKQR
jgi:hypothetical protein